MQKYVLWIFLIQSCFRKWKFCRREALTIITKSKCLTLGLSFIHVPQLRVLFWFLMVFGIIRDFMAFILISKHIKLHLSAWAIHFVVLADNEVNYGMLLCLKLHLEQNDSFKIIFALQQWCLDPSSVCARTHTHTRGKDFCSLIPLNVLMNRR